MCTIVVSSIATGYGDQSIVDLVVVNIAFLSALVFIAANYFLDFILLIVVSTRFAAFCLVESRLGAVSVCYATLVSLQVETLPANWHMFLFPRS